MREGCAAARLAAGFLGVRRAVKSNSYTNGRDMSLTKNRPSPWMLVAVAALAFAMVGTAVAGPSSVSKLTKSKVKSIAKKQADKELKANVAGSHVNVADKATAADSASNAAAVGGQSVSKLFTKIPAGTGNTTVFTGNGFTLQINCVAGSLNVSATTSVNDSILFSEGNNNGTAFGTRSSDFDVGDVEDPLSTQPRGDGSIQFSTPTGSYVNILFAGDDSNTFDTFDGCVFVGNAIAG
jgi:hypothetical protein